MDKRDIDRMQKLVRHIHNVQENSLILAERLMEKGELIFAKKLVAQCMSHDISEFVDMLLLPPFKPVSEM